MEKAKQIVKLINLIEELYKVIIAALLLFISSSIYCK